jgi:hypothetical protein
LERRFEQDEENQEGSEQQESRIFEKGFPESRGKKGQKTKGQDRKLDGKQDDQNDPDHDEPPTLKWSRGHQLPETAGAVSANPIACLVS